jgi:EAL domain-containing protein (putative c-di-GMP-specific phosphodiesterase class I)/CheY-like chemotaxis protein
MRAEKIRILLVDDDRELTATVRGVLEAQGYDVLTANDGEEGLELAYTERPHLILLDLMMPGMDGYRVCRELQFGYTKDIPIVILTAKRELPDMMEASRCGATAFVTKPFRVDHLLQTVRNVLRDASVYYDDITGLPTLANVQVEMQRVLADHPQLGIIYVSLDGVYALERLQGFEVVDDVFRVIGQRLLAARGDLLRSDDYVSVSSLGDAFLIVLSPAREQATIGERDLVAVKRRLEERLLGDLERELEDRLLMSIDVFVGYARLTRSPKVRFRRALLQAISEATTRIEGERAEVRDRLGHELERILAADDISCVYQPVVRLKDYVVIGYELLARGPAQSDLHCADALFDVARETGHLVELDRLCRRTAAHGSASLPGHFLRFVNIDPAALFHVLRDVGIGEYVGDIPEALRTSTILEITEKSVIDDFSHCREVIAQLRSHGFKVAVDDAGAGYSGLQTIVETEPDYIKLDISLTRNLDESLVKQKLVRTLGAFCRDAGIELIAEGVETRAQLDALVRLEVPLAQGYLFAQPGSPYPLVEHIDPTADAHAVVDEA